MKNIVNKSILLSIIVLAWSLCPFLGEATAQQKPSTEDLQTRIQKLENDLKGDFSAVGKDIKAIRKSIKDLQQTLEEQKTTQSLKLSTALQRIHALENALSKMKGSEHLAKRPENNGIAKDGERVNIPQPPPNGTPQDAKDQGPSVSSDKLKKIANRLKKLESQVAKMAESLSELQQRTSYYPSDLSDLSNLKRRLGTLEQGMEQLQRQAPRVAKSPPPTGRIVLTNLTGESRLFLLNGRPIRVNPYSYMVLDNQPVGQWTYEVISSTSGSSGERITSLRPGETLNLTSDS